jgi:undecaprenyl diphosphate synthase
MSKYLELIDRKKIPRHVAVIMDGNGRWAKKRDLPRNEGHRAGALVIEKLINAADSLGIECVSVYAFSTENWSRPPLEIKGLFGLLDYYFKLKLDTFMKNGIRITHSGVFDRMPKSTVKRIKDAVELTKNNKKLTLNFCLNYGGRREIIDAFNSWNRNNNGKKLISEKELEKNLYTKGLPQVDLMIRTSGEMRISNFLIWQCAYAEFVFLNVLWPDFKPSHLYRAVYEYQLRNRRFGGL